MRRYIGRDTLPLQGNVSLVLTCPLSFWVEKERLKALVVYNPKHDEA
jgi:hypothetical protein